MMFLFQILHLKQNYIKFSYIFLKIKQFSWTWNFD